MSGRRARKGSRGFDWSSAETDQFLLRISYLGTRFFGLAWQTPKSCTALFAESRHKRRRLGESGAEIEHNTSLAEDPPALRDWYPLPKDSDRFKNSQLTVPTVEGVLIEALQKANLIKDRDSCNFSRCGRTDKGVHARANYVSLQMRLKPKRSHPEDHYDYRAMLNAILPRSIKVLQVQRVPSWFDARFHCLYRAYKYFFPVTSDLDVALMKTASLQFVGEHDFRNFCKIDPQSQKTFKRRVLRFDIALVKDGSVAVADVVGPAFLWHQVRCMMGVLLNIGKGALDPCVISTWLDITKTTSKPAYVMAPPDGLVLWDCVFEGLQFDDFDPRSVKSFQEMESELAVHQNVLQCLQSGNRICTM
eukprot:Gregarina_sp_Pseudo_9__3139@NODE_332_length_3137_cov_74_877986_g312_i0_p2_GENE_NODE_332_length_3137_cov_74_877986_g312_i0NODE_332_length_3137_cov_74_877986_g312_i0_p2_ORF_typecomplete_len362_score68_56PseudoU_synth_1/PF01416_20/0_029PseudoU_synth_1/PF01416_20/2_7e24DUF2344/PF10105_9/0_035_NODE_332_length_3137_cov_74_877986_g312_i02521337